MYQQGYYNNVQSPMSQPMQYPVQSNITYVQGEVGARSYLVAPNARMALWDSEQPVIYLKSTDINGMPTMQIIDYQVRSGQTNQNNHNQTNALVEDLYVTKEDFNTLQNKVELLEEKIGGLSK